MRPKRDEAVRGRRLALLAMAHTEEALAHLPGPLDDRFDLEEHRMWSIVLNMCIRAASSPTRREVLTCRTSRATVAFWVASSPAERLLVRVERSSGASSYSSPTVMYERSAAGQD